jgi:hypothetical protein
MKIRYYDLLLTTAVVAIAAPAWARTDTATLTFGKTAHVGSTMLAPGSYKVRAEENGKQIEFEKDGKVIAQIPCHWIQLNAKPQNDEALVDNDTVQEIRFEGRTAAAQID